MSDRLPPIKDRMTKTIVLQRMDTHQSTIIEADLEGKDKEVNFSHILKHYCPLQTHTVQIYDSYANAFLPLRIVHNSITDSHLIEPSFILLRFRPRTEPLHPRGTSREDRSKERTIGEAIQLVRQWRALHETRRDCPNKGRKRLSLPQAARMLGVPKKSLDDYYCQLRIAEMHGFEFQTHLQEGVGILRAFVKQKRQQRKSVKHPKILRLIEDLNFCADIEPPQSTTDHLEANKEHSKKNNQQTGKSAKEEQANVHELAMSEEADKQKLISELQYEYYRGFEYLLDEPIDPFVTLNRNFSVRLFDDDQSNSIHFF